MLLRRIFRSGCETTRSRGIFRTSCISNVGRPRLLAAAYSATEICPQPFRPKCDQIAAAGGSLGDFRTFQGSIFPAFAHHRGFHTSAARLGDEGDERKPMTVFQKFKDLWKKYWYIVVPVHFGTYAVWIGGFYFAAKTGLDLVGYMEMIPMIPESWIGTLKNAPAASNLAAAYLMCKVISPVRYFTTVVCTHGAMRGLTHFGLIKPYAEYRDDFADYYKDKRRSLDKRRRGVRLWYQKHRRNLLSKKQNGHSPHSPHSQQTEERAAGGPHRNGQKRHFSRAPSPLLVRKHPLKSENDYFL